MNIFLTCFGVDTRHKENINGYNEIINLLKEKKVVIIPNARLINQNRESAININKELILNNINSKIVDIDKTTINLNDFDVIYFTGGEPKYLMDSIYNANLYNDIIKFIKDKKYKIGQSAGAMIFSKKYLDTSSGKLKILNNGFDISKKIIVPHYNNLPSTILENIPKNIITINDFDKLIKLK